MFSLSASAVRRPHTLNSTSTSKSFQSTVTGELSAPYSKQFVHSKSSQYRKMKTEWKSNVYLARSRIQVSRGWVSGTARGRQGSLREKVGVRRVRQKAAACGERRPVGKWRLRPGRWPLHLQSRDADAVLPQMGAGL